MSAHSPITELLGRLAYSFAKIQPFLPTYLHLLASALFPIYTGAHASLSPPASAAKHSKGKTNTDDDDDDASEPKYQKMEGMSPTDALIIPLMAGCTLAILYFIIKWLQDPALLNLIINWYLSVFGVVSVAHLATDFMAVITTYAFPAMYEDNGQVWRVQRDRRIFETMQEEGNASAKPSTCPSPLPGRLSRLPLSRRLLRIIWTLRELTAQKLHIHVRFYTSTEARFRIGLQGLSGILLAIAALLYFNLVDKPWWLTNILGFSVSYSVLQLMSPTTFWTGTMILGSLFVYDIYFVFFTPLMITVATKLDIPAKLLFPRPRGPDDDPNKEALSMLGLGDVVLPGMMIGLALRFDLYLFYLRKQTRGKKIDNDVAMAAKVVGTAADQDTMDAQENVAFEETGLKTEDKTEHKTNNVSSEIVKAPWRSATGTWGERFWLGRFSGTEDHLEGSAFPKTYFHAALAGYIFGMVCTLSVMHVYIHAQPALLYLVPSVLGSLWLTALVKGDLEAMWEYTEAPEEEASKNDNDGKLGKPGIKSIFSFTRHKERTAKAEKEAQPRAAVDKSEIEAKKKNKVKEDDTKSASLGSTRDRVLFLFSISLPSKTASRPKDKPKSPETSPNPDVDLTKASEGEVRTDNSSGRSSPRSKSFGGEDEAGEELGRKRQRLF